MTPPISLENPAQSVCTSGPQEARRALAVTAWPVDALADGGPGLCVFCEGATAPSALGPWHWFRGGRLSLRKSRRSNKQKDYSDERPTSDTVRHLDDSIASATSGEITHPNWSPLSIAMPTKASRMFSLIGPFLGSGCGNPAVPTMCEATICAGGPHYVLAVPLCAEPLYAGGAHWGATDAGVALSTGAAQCTGAALCTGSTLCAEARCVGPP